MAREEGSIESRAKQRRTSNPEYTSPVQEVLNSALSLFAVVAITLVSGIVLHTFVGRKPA